jgi:acyl-coenzyme A thioesterase PaaI-like protein
MEHILTKAIQDYYPEDLSYCYGCGRLNPHGNHLRSAWDGDETVAYFTPSEQHIAIPGFVYGGLLASLVDCHGTGSAALAAYKQAEREWDSLPAFRFVTGSLQVSYLKPTPLGVELEIRGKIVEIKGRKVTTEITISANGEITVKGQVIAVQVPENMLGK